MWNWGYICNDCDEGCGESGPYSEESFETEEDAIDAESLEIDIPWCWKPFFYEDETK